MKSWPESVSPFLLVHSVFVAPHINRAPFGLRRSYRGIGGDLTPGSGAWTCPHGREPDPQLWVVSTTALWLCWEWQRPKSRMESQSWLDDFLVTVRKLLHPPAVPNISWHWIQKSPLTLTQITHTQVTTSSKKSSSSWQPMDYTVKCAVQLQHENWGNIVHLFAEHTINVHFEPWNNKAFMIHLSFRALISSENTVIFLRNYFN